MRRPELRCAVGVLGASGAGKSTMIKRLGEAVERGVGEAGRGAEADAEVRMVACQDASGKDYDAQRVAAELEIECESFTDFGTRRFGVALKEWKGTGMAGLGDVAAIKHSLAAAIVVFDLSSISSFMVAQELVRELRDTRDGRQVELVLVGNKADLSSSKRAVSTFSGLDFASLHRASYEEASAFDGTKARSLVGRIAARALKQALESNVCSAADLAEMSVREETAIELRRK